ncbi:MAG: gfo/Idh/MocA family oxidoreductase, partial [Enterococcus sp.]
SVTILQNQKNELATISLTFQAKMPKKGIVAFENGYLTVDDYPRADKAELFFNDGTTELIESGFTGNAMNYEIENMVKVIKGELPNKSLFFTKDVIDILD